MRMRESCWNTYSSILNEYIPGNACSSLTISMSAVFSEWVESMYSLQNLHHEQAEVAYYYLKLEFA